MSLVVELTKLVDLLEATIPANQRSLKNQKFRARLMRRMAEYFSDLERAFPYSKLASLYNKYVVKENIREAVPRKGSDDILSPILRTLRTKLIVDIVGQQVSIYMSASVEVVTWGKTKGGIPIAFEGPPISQAISWAEKHGAQLVTQMDEETKRRLARVISKGIENKRGIPGLTRDIKDMFKSMTRHRSELIARTETANALSEASIDTMKALGITGKEWITVGDKDVTDECLANEAQGIIPVDNQFSGGVMAPPQHPDCRCAVSPAKLRRK